MDRRAFAPCGDQALLPQHRQVAGKVGLGEAEPAAKLARRDLAFDQAAQNHQPMAAGERPKERLRLGGVRFKGGWVEF